MVRFASGKFFDAEISRNTKQDQRNVFLGEAQVITTDFVGYAIRQTVSRLSDRPYLITEHTYHPDYLGSKKH